MYPNDLKSLYSLLKEDITFVSLDLNYGPLSVLIVSFFVSTFLHFVALSMHSMKFFKITFIVLLILL